MLPVAARARKSHRGVLRHSPANETRKMTPAVGTSQSNRWRRCRQTGGAQCLPSRCLFRSGLPPVVILIAYFALTASTLSLAISGGNGEGAVAVLVSMVAIPLIVIMSVGWAVVTNWAIAEAIKVFLDIQNNTHKSAECVDRLLRK